MTASLASRFAQLRHSRSDKEKYHIKEDEKEWNERTAGLRTEYRADLEKGPQTCYCKCSDSKKDDRKTCKFKE